MNTDIIREKIDSNEYKPKAPYVRPYRATPPTNSELITFMENEGKGLTLEQAKKALMDKYLKLQEESQKGNQLYNQQAANGYQEFCDDMAEAFKMKGHPLWSPLLGMAYDQGHSSGFSDILCCMETYIDHLRAVIEGYDFVPKKK